MGLIPQLTDAGKAMMVKALTGSALNFTCIKIGNADAPTDLTSGDYWYDTENSVLYQYLGVWTLSDASITISANEPTADVEGELWYNTTTGMLYVCTAGWTAENTTFYVGSSEPSDAVNGSYWYDIENEILYVCSVTEGDDETTTSWTAADINFTYSADAPEDASSGDWWYSTSSDTVYSYGFLWSYDSADNFTYSAASPSDALSGDLWYDTTDAELNVYALGWFAVTDINFTYSALPPSDASAGDWWYCTSDTQLYEYTGAAWAANGSDITCSISAPNAAGSLTDLINPMLTSPITEMLTGSNYVSLTTKLSNSEVGTGFQWTETGVFAQIDGGDEELYAYCNAGDLYDYIPAADSGRTIDLTFTLLVMVGDAEDVTATIGEGALYASKVELSDHIGDTNNPHSVTKEQVGLGKVENVAAADVEITYDTATSLSEPVSGESASTFMGKVKKTVATLIKHLKAENPHSITVSKIGAAASSHTHSASDVTSGTLAVTRGGTGVSSYAALLTALGLGDIDEQIDAVEEDVANLGYTVKTVTSSTETLSAGIYFIHYTAAANMPVSTGSYIITLFDEYDITSDGNSTWRLIATDLVTGKRYRGTGVDSGVSTVLASSDLKWTEL